MDFIPNVLIISEEGKSLNTINEYLLDFTMPENITTVFSSDEAFEVLFQNPIEIIIGHEDLLTEDLIAYINCKKKNSTFILISKKIGISPIFNSFLKLGAKQALLEPFSRRDFRKAIDTAIVTLETKKWILSTSSNISRSKTPLSPLNN